MSTPEARELLERMGSERGAVPEQFRMMAELDPRYLELFHETYVHVMQQSAHLDRKVKEIVLVAVDAVTYYHYGTKFHMKAALEHGATAHEIMEALALAGMACGIHVPSAAMPLLREALDEFSADARAKVEGQELV
jgi:AhpD family alkylhydroperoxidase